MNKPWLVCSSMRTLRINVANVPSNGWTNHDWFVHPCERCECSLKWINEPWLVCISMANVGNVPQLDVFGFSHRKRWEISFKMHVSIISTIYQHSDSFHCKLLAQGTFALRYFHTGNVPRQFSNTGNVPRQFINPGNVRSAIFPHGERSTSI